MRCCGRLMGAVYDDAFWMVRQEQVCGRRPRTIRMHSTQKRTDCESVSLRLLTRSLERGFLAADYHFARGAVDEGVYEEVKFLVLVARQWLGGCAEHEDVDGVVFRGS